METTIEPKWMSLGIEAEGGHPAMVNLNQVIMVQDNSDGEAEALFTNGMKLNLGGSTREFYEAISEENSNSKWTKQDLLTRFKAGFETSVVDKAHDYEMWRVNRSLTKTNELHLLLDDPLGTMGAVSSWSTSATDIVSDQILRKIGDLPIEVWLGDVKIKEAAE